MFPFSRVVVLSSSLYLYMRFFLMHLLSLFVLLHVLSISRVCFDDVASSDINRYYPTSSSPQAGLNNDCFPLMYRTSGRESAYMHRLQQPMMMLLDRSALHAARTSNIGSGYMDSLGLCSTAYITEFHIRFDQWIKQQRGLGHWNSGGVCS